MPAKDIGKTLKELRLNANLTQKQAYEYIGVAQSTFSSWETGKAEPPTEVLLNLCQLYKVDDILAAFGYGGYNEDGSLSLNMYEVNLVEKYRKIDDFGRSTVNYILDREVERLNQSESIKEQPAAYAENITVLPTLVQRICAGTGSIGDDVLYEEGQYPAISVPDGSQYAAVITGNSMEPEFYDGDIVFYKKVDSLNYGDIGIFNLNDENIIKKYEKTGLHALNPEYEDVIPASDDHVVIIGKVLGKM